MKKIATGEPLYLDTTYIAKFYFNEPESPRVRELVRKAGPIHSSLWALAEFHAVLHRRMREGAASPGDARDLALRFSKHASDGLWNLVPVHEALLRRTGALMISAPRDLFLRTADAVHLVTAHELGEREVWTNDRHMLAAAAYFGLAGRSVRI
ncbi:MAG TPA: type II toxin-antitoxin system VapC family toxin [Bryobacteraceae bacterium]|nr:type II toxin-antitoxin system VapC family toxin [Bryobacteraceae bacterium]